MSKKNVLAAYPNAAFTTVQGKNMIIDLATSNVLGEGNGATACWANAAKRIAEASKPVVMAEIATGFTMTGTAEQIADTMARQHAAIAPTPEPTKEDIVTITLPSGEPLNAFRVGSKEKTRRRQANKRARIARRRNRLRA